MYPWLLPSSRLFFFFVSFSWRFVVSVVSCRFLVLYIPPALQYNIVCECRLAQSEKVQIWIHPYRRPNCKVSSQIWPAQCRKTWDSSEFERSRWRPWLRWWLSRSCKIKQMTRKRRTCIQKAIKDKRISKMPFLLNKGQQCAVRSLHCKWIRYLVTFWRFFFFFSSVLFFL